VCVCKSLPGAVRLNDQQAAGDSAAKLNVSDEYGHGMFDSQCMTIAKIWTWNACCWSSKKKSETLQPLSGDDGENVTVQ